MRNRIFAVAGLVWSVLWGGTLPSSVRADEKSSVTVFPVVAAPERFPDDFAIRVGSVIATLLEKEGLENLTVAEQMFLPPQTDDVEKIAKALGQYVSDHPIQTDFAVFAQFLGTPATGVQGIRLVVVDKSGKVHLAESAGDAEFDKAPIRPQDPMSCCVFVSQRLQTLWQLADPLRPNAPEGKMAEFWRRDAGIPAQEELDAIAKRAESLKAKIDKATITLYPLRVAGRSDAAAARALSAMLNENGIGATKVSDADPALTVAGHSNEQRVLWDTARAFRDYGRTHQPATEYAMFADYGVFGDKVGYVHFVICDRAGEWVSIEMMNSHHAEFQRTKPKSAADCHRMVLARLQNSLGK